MILHLLFDLMVSDKVTSTNLNEPAGKEHRKTRKYCNRKAGTATLNCGQLNSSSEFFK